MKQIKVKFALNPQETVLFKVNGSYLKNKWQAKPGALCLTNERIVVEGKSMTAFLLFGVIGWLLTRKKVITEFPLTDITNFSRGKQGFNKKVAVFELLDGSTVRMAVTGKWEVFEAAYHKAMLDVKPLFSVN
nr:PH domain-containing protein [uncultured Chitinophaga sp.]